MSGAIHLLALYAFTAWTQTTLPLPYALMCRKEIYVSSVSGSVKVMKSENANT
jgi:hypothetical protein